MMNADLGLAALRLAVGVVIMAHGAIKIGWPVSMGPARRADALRTTAGWFGGLRFWPPMFWALVSVLAEFGGGLLIIAGLGGPIGPGLVFGDMIVVTIVLTGRTGSGSRRTAGSSRSCSSRAASRSAWSASVHGRSMRPWI